MDVASKRELNRRQKREIEHVLASEFNKAKADELRTRLRLRQVIQEIPSGLQAPDSNLRITQAAKAHKSAVQSLQTALDRWSDFVAKGKIPADVLQLFPSE